MDTVLTTEIIENAMNDVKTYKAAVDNLYNELVSVLNGLTPQDFEGEAATGYMTFFNSKVTPALTDNLTQLTDGINTLLQSIREQLMEKADPELGHFNENPGDGSAQ